MNELDDLGNLFEFGDIDLNNVPDVDAGGYGDQIQEPHSQHGTHPNTPFHDLAEPSLLSGSAVTDFAGQEQLAMMQGMDQQSQHRYSGQVAHLPGSHAYAPGSLYQSAVSQAHQPEAFHFHAAPNYPPAHHIPPTPNSYDMHGRAGSFMGPPQQHQHFYSATMEQQRYQMQKDGQIAFTPLASPAGTPQFHMLPEFTTPGAYFSPLSSPMLHAQTSQHPHVHAHAQPYTPHPNTAPNSAAPSPNEANLDVEMGSNETTQDLSNRRSRRKIATPKSVASTGKAKASPAQKGRKRNPSKKATSDDLRRVVTYQPSSASLRHPDSSEAESISPEPLNESLMGPPPRPGSTLAQPTSTGEQRGNIYQTAGAAATPKSLLQRRGAPPTAGSQQSPASSQQISDLGGLDDLALPEAARPPARAPAPINTEIAQAVDEGDTPRISARKTPKFDASSTPLSARPTSALPSPAVGPSPATAASTPAAMLKDSKDGKGGRVSKKRGSVSQSASKNLPRISPSIKPLLPEGSKSLPNCRSVLRSLLINPGPLHSSTQALLLASKSNYQNILEGNHLPGVNYPDSLSSGLTSKRTSHKVAEQGRRNRINDALKEMQSLVPKPSPATKAAMKEVEASNEGSPDGGGEEDKGGGEGGGSKEESAAKSSNSKAATVELANEYIKKMQKDFAARDAEMEVLRRENDELRKKLGQGGVVDGCEDVSMDGVSSEAS